MDSTSRFREIEKKVCTFLFESTNLKMKNFFYAFSSTKRFVVFENLLCTFLSTLNFRVFQNWVCTFLSTFQNLKVKKIFCTFLLQLQNLKVKKNPTKKYFKKHRLNAVNTLFETIKTEKFRFTSIFHGFKKYFPKTQRLKLLAQNLAVIKYNGTRLCLVPTY